MTGPSPPVQNPLTMVMKVKSPEDYAALQKTVEHLQSLPPDKNPVTIALNKIVTVHFARFTFLDNDQLAVITSYDGDFEVYINEFINEIGDVFNMLMEHVEEGPPLPVQTYRQEFLRYIRAHDFGCAGTFYSAYPDRIGDISAWMCASRELRARLPRHSHHQRCHCRVRRHRAALGG